MILGYDLLVSFNGAAMLFDSLLFVRQLHMPLVLYLIRSETIKNVKGSHAALLLCPIIDSVSHYRQFVAEVRS